VIEFELIINGEETNVFLIERQYLKDFAVAACLKNGPCHATEPERLIWLSCSSAESSSAFSPALVRFKTLNFSFCSDTLRDSTAVPLLTLISSNPFHSQHDVEAYITLLCHQLSTLFLKLVTTTSH
jgi:hypothetical protein